MLRPALLSKSVHPLYTPAKKVGVHVLRVPRGGGGAHDCNFSGNYNTSANQIESIHNDLGWLSHIARIRRLEILGGGNN